MVYLGGIGPHHCLEEAIGALRQLPKVHLVLVGWGEQSYLQTLYHKTIQFGVNERVHFLGEVEDKWRVLDSSDWAFCVYRSDTLRLTHVATASNKFFEALSAGLPTVVPNRADFRAILGQYDVGVYAEELTQNGIAAAMRELYENPRQTGLKSRNARKAHEQIFHYEKQFEAVAALFHMFS